MSDFDDLLGAADADIADAFGDTAVLNDGAVDHPVRAILDKGVAVFTPGGNVDENHISIPSPPVVLKNGFTVTFDDTGEVYTLREERYDDGFFPGWAATLNA